MDLCPVSQSVVAVAVAAVAAAVAVYIFFLSRNVCVCVCVCVGVCEGLTNTGQFTIGLLKVGDSPPPFTTASMKLPCSSALHMRSVTNT